MNNTPLLHGKTLRLLENGRNMGMVEIEGTAWNHGDALTVLGNGERAYWGKGYQKDGLVHRCRCRLLLNRDGCSTDLISMGILRDEWQRTAAQDGMRSSQEEDYQPVFVTGKPPDRG
jgi:hypothetical protein